MISFIQLRFRFGIFLAFLMDEQEERRRNKNKNSSLLFTFLTSTPLRAFY